MSDSFGQFAVSQFWQVTWLDCEPSAYARVLLQVIDRHCARRAPRFVLGLSPFEVTAERLSDIVKHSGRLRRNTPCRYWLVVFVTALLVIPGAGRSTEREFGTGAGTAIETEPNPVGASKSIPAKDTAIEGPGPAPLSVRNVPPVVIETYPRAGEAGVSPECKQIRVTFSKSMLRHSWSWVQLSPTSFPEIVGQPRYREDGRTCAVDVRLQPNRTYAIWFNTTEFQNFRDRAGQASIPYLLVFRTGEKP